METLPYELLRDIVSRLDDCASLYNLLRASPAISRLFDHDGLQLTRALFSKDNMCDQIRESIHFMAMLDSSSSFLHPSLNAFITDFIHVTVKDVLPQPGNPPPTGPSLVGEVGDSGVIQISDMLFTVKGATAGCILMEWNIHESTQGSAAMWDSHFRVGGAEGSDLQMDNCPKGSGINTDCIAASMLLHLTEQSSGYFENLWVWTADHDLDEPVGSANTTTASQLNIFTGRGVWVESQGPTWFYGTSVEHSVLYQLTLSGAKDIFITHVQTETPYSSRTQMHRNPLT
ncbi:hypothetical protein BDV12DRAFT_201538 [Aspergillus spectabilis]